MIMLGRWRAGLMQPILAAALWCLIATTHAEAPELLGGLPTLEDVALSPDGSRIVFVRTEDDTRIAMVVSLAERKSIASLKVGETKVRAIQWADNDHLLVTTSMTALPYGFLGSESEWTQMQIWDLKTHKTFIVPDPATVQRIDNDGIMNVVEGAPMVRQVGGHTVLFVHGRVRGGDHNLIVGLFRTDLATEHQQLLRTGGVNTRWVIDESGEIAAESSYTERDQRWLLRINYRGRLREVTQTHAPIDVPSILGFGPTPDTLLVGMLEDGRPIWRLVSLNDGSVGDPLAEHAMFTAPIEDSRSHRMIGGERIGDAASYVFFDPMIQNHWLSILHAFPDEHVNFVSTSADFQKIVVLVDGARDGYAYELVDLGTHKADRIGEVYQGLTQVLVKQRVTYPAADGLKIPAYLTVPAGREPKGLPLVVLVHGGPAATDTALFDWWSQALADQGYAVLQPNYRGSTVSEQFLTAGFGQFGRKMQTDLSDGVRHLVSQGIVDASRVCIVGASYGGYAALAGATLDPGVYRCAVSVAGISDIKLMLDRQGGFGGGTNVAVRYWDRFMGINGAHDPVMDAISPIKHLEGVNIPVLLIHGKDDTVVPYEQSAVMYDAMRRAGKTVEMVTLKREDHWLSRSQTRRQMLESSLRFLKEHNPPDPAAPASASATRAATPPP